MRFLSVPPKWAVLSVVAPLYSGALVILRGRPTIHSDPGIFLSVAARLLHGDRLYSEVWDNKAPFFYYTYTLGLEIGGWRGPFLLDVLWISLASISMWLLLAVIGASAWARAVGAVVYPLLLTGAWYSAGYSELPSLALAPAVAWLWLRGHSATAGVLLGVLAFFRPDYALVFAALIVAPSLVRAVDRAAFPRNAVRLLAGLVAASTASVVVLAARGELTGYVGTMRANVGYPNRVLIQIGERSGIIGHATLVGGMLVKDRARGALLGLVASALLVLLVAAIRRRSHWRSTSGTPEPLTMLSTFLVGTAAAAAVTLALTAVWYHNLELIALPATFATCFLTSRVEGALRDRAQRFAAMIATAAVCVAAFGGLSLDHPSSPASWRSLSDWTRTPRSTSAIALDREAAKVRVRNRPVTYARLGANDDDAHAAFIKTGLQLACPVFHQYTYSSNLDQALACIRNRRPELLLVAPSLAADHRPTTQRWDAFVADSRRLLRAQYIDALAIPEKDGDLVVWRRR